MSALGAKMYELVRTVKARLNIPFALRLAALRMPRLRHLPDGAAPFRWARRRESARCWLSLILARLVQRPARRPTI